MDWVNLYDEAMNSTDQVIDNWFASNGSMVTSISSFNSSISMRTTTKTSTIPTPVAAAAAAVITKATRTAARAPSMFATSMVASTSSTSSWLSMERIQIILYATILLLAIVGNTLVILTLIQNRRMRTITNVFLLNLAISDVLLGVLCMPITLVGTLLRDFIFGEVMCKLLPYLQACSVAVSAWTLVAIALERYYAICDPLRSRRWQTLSHAYKLIALIWCSSLIFMSPIAVFNQIIPTNQGHRKCRELWPESTRNYERSYNLLLDAALLIIPLAMLTIAYFSITKTLWQGMALERSNGRRYHHKSTANNGCQRPERSSLKICLNSNVHARSNCTIAYSSRRKATFNPKADHMISYQVDSDNDTYSMTNPNCGPRKLGIGLRRLQNKKRVIQMLFVVVLEFFICWTPLYIINTITLFDSQIVYQTLGYQTITYLHLLAYSSSCCNPITYCFMNRGFRKACLNLFRCCRRINETRRISIGGAPIGVTQSSEVT